MILGNGLAAHQLVTYIAQGAIGGDIAVDEVLDGSQIGDNDRWAPRGDIHSGTVGLGLRQCKDGGRRNLVGLKTHQRSVDVEKQCVSLFHSNVHKKNRLNSLSKLGVSIPFPIASRIS